MAGRWGWRNTSTTQQPSNSVFNLASSQEDCSRCEPGPLRMDLTSEQLEESTPTNPSREGDRPQIQKRMRNDRKYYNLSSDSNLNMDGQWETNLIGSNWSKSSWTISIKGFRDRLRQKETNLAPISLFNPQLDIAIVREAFNLISVTKMTMCLEDSREEYAPRRMMETYQRPLKSLKEEALCLSRWVRVLSWPQRLDRAKESSRTWESSIVGSYLRSAWSQLELSQR